MSKTPINLNGKTILVTGSPGFIGANLVMRLRRELTGGTVISFDNMNDYYDPELKEYRLRMINAIESPVRHVFVKGSIADKELVDSIFEAYRPDIVVNLAAQAGVRYSIDHPDVYIESNLIGFYNILQHPRSLPPLLRTRRRARAHGARPLHRRRAPCLRLQLLRLRRQQKSALRSGRQSRQPCLPLRGH